MKYPSTAPRLITKKGGFVDVNDLFFVKFLGCTGREIDSLELLCILFLFCVEFDLFWEVFLDIVFWIS